MTGPTASEVRASMRDGLKVAAFAAAAVIAAVATFTAGHHGTALVILAVTFGGVWLEGLPKAARARRRYPR